MLGMNHCRLNAPQNLPATISRADKGVVSSVSHVRLSRSPAISVAELNSASSMTTTHPMIAMGTLGSSSLSWSSPSSTYIHVAPPTTAAMPTHITHGLANAA
jgi:hypothetical protein